MEIRKIPLTRGKFAIIDADDFELVNRLKWYYQPSRDSSSNNGYAQKSVFNKSLYKETKKVRNTYIRMHNLIMSPPKGMVVDHVNHDGLDNRKINLRIITKAENHFNLPRRKNKMGRFRGVTKNNNKFQATLTVNKKRLYLGLFLTEEKAALAYNAAAKKHFGQCANFNKI